MQPSPMATAEALADLSLPRSGEKHARQPFNPSDLLDEDEEESSSDGGTPIRTSAGGTHDLL